MEEVVVELKMRVDGGGAERNNEEQPDENRGPRLMKPAVCTGDGIHDDDDYYYNDEQKEN